MKGYDITISNLYLHLLTIDLNDVPDDDILVIDYRGEVAKVCTNHEVYNGKDWVERYHRTPCSHRGKVNKAVLGTLTRLGCDRDGDTVNFQLFLRVMKSLLN